MTGSHEGGEAGGTAWEPTDAFEVADGHLRRWRAADGTTTVDASPGWLTVDGSATAAGLSFARERGLTDGVPTLGTVLDLVADLPADRVRGFRARPPGDDGEVGAAFVDVDLAGVVAEATVRADGRVPVVEYRSDLDGETLERAAGVALGAWRDPVDASADRRERLPDPPEVVIDRAPEAGQRVTTRATVHVHRAGTEDPGRPDEHLLVVGPFPERNDHEFERAATVTHARWFDETAPFGVDEVVDLRDCEPGTAAYEAGLATRRAVEGALDLTDRLAATAGRGESPGGSGGREC